MMKNMKKLWALLLALTMVLSLAACGGSREETAKEEAPAETQEEQAPVEENADADSDLAYVQDKGVLVVGITDFEPMDYKDADGNWIGFDADMAKVVAEKLGVEVEFIEIDWDSKIMELDSGNIDVVWNGMTLTDAVMEAMECSTAYCNNAQVVVTK